tara:strand:+ start:311 stop:3481 length:3171 start_codon:yes stop_codon:yes gene_type:complete
MDKPADKAKKQMQSMGLSAPYMGSKETRTEEEVVQDRKTLAENVPILGEAMLAKEIAGDVKDENYFSAGLNTLALGVGAVPVAGDILNKPIRAAAKKLRKVDKDAATKMLSDVNSIETWKKQNPNPKPQKQNPDIEKSANDLLEGKITGKQHRSVVKENMPIVKIDEVPEMPSFTEIVGALDKDKSTKGILGLNKSVKDGTRVSSRLDIPAYERFDKWVVSVHDAFDKKGKESLNGDIIGYGKTAILKNVDFKGLPQGAANIAAKRNPKGTIARIFGDYYNAEPENVAEYAKRVIKNKNWTQVGYNPFRHGFFYDKNTGMPVKSAEEVIQVGPLVLAKNAQKIKISEAKQVGPKGGLKIRTGKPIEGLQNLKETKTVFNKGGVVPMNNMSKQMELFEPVERGFDEGGLMDEGGTVDPVSGNDVPPGSTQEEVRDDIPAQLSEGEFVFPADVVRYIGLESLMRMRQEAKQGLAQMEAMGQMGNSEEATVEDNLPFDMYDLDIEEDEEYNMASGGVIKAANGTFTLPNTTGGYKAPDPVTTSYTQPSQPTQTFQPYTPQFTTATQTEGAFQPKTLDPVTPAFSEFIGQNIPGVDFEYVNYVNESGQIIRLRKDKATGELLDPIPEGYTLESEQVKSATTTPTTTLGQTSVRDEGDGGNDNESSTTGASIALGGKAVGPAIGGGIPGTRFAGPSRRVVGSTLYDVSFKNVGLNPAAFAFNMITKDGGLPPEGIGVIGVKGNRKATIELPAVVYNILRNDPRGQQAKAVQEALAARDALTSGNKASYVDGVLSVENKDGDMVAVSKDAIDLIGSTMYSELQDEAKGTLGFGKTDNLVDTARDYYSGMNAGPDVVDDFGRTMSTEEKNARDALSAYNDQQFSDFVTEEDVSDYYSGKGTLGGKSYNDSPSDNTSDNSSSSADSSSNPADDGSNPICLTEDMKVKLNGAIDFVTNVKVGDIVGSTIVTEVLHKHMREGYYVVNGELKITNDHPVFANGSWKRTEDLVLGDYINTVEVTSLEYVEQVTPTVYIGTADERYDVYTEGEVYTVHGQYKNGLKKAA